MLFRLSFAVHVRLDAKPPYRTAKGSHVAVINGRKVTLAEFKRMLAVQDPKMKALAMQQPKAFLDEYALYETVLSRSPAAQPATG